MNDKSMMRGSGPVQSSSSQEEKVIAPTIVDTMTDDIRVTIDDVLTVKNELVNKIVNGNKALLPDVRELLIAIYIRGFFTGAHMQNSDTALRSELMMEVVKGRLLGGLSPE